MVTLLVSLLLFADTLTLYPEDAVRLALEKNFDRVEAGYQIEAAKIQSKGAFFNLLPFGSLSGNYSKYRQEGKTFDRVGYTFSVEQILFDPERFMSYYSAKNSLKLQELSYSSLKSDIKVKTLKLFYKVLTVQEKVDYLREAVKLSEKEYKNLKIRMELGMATELDVLRARINYLQNQNSLRQAEIELEQAKRELKFYIGVPEETEVSIGVKGIPYENFEVHLTKELKDSVVRAQEDLRKLLLQAEEAEWSYKKSLFSFLPRIYIGYQKTYDRLDPGYTTDYSTTGFYLNFSLNLNSYPFNVRLQKNRLQLQKFYIKRATYSIMKDLDDAYDTWKAAKLNFELAKENEKLADLLYKKSYEKFKAGEITSLEYFDSQVKLKEASLRLIEARYSYYVALISLKTLLGMEVLR